MAKGGGPELFSSTYRWLVKQRNLASHFSVQSESRESHCGYEKSIVPDGDKVNNEEKEKKKKHKTTE